MTAVRPNYEGVSQPIGLLERKSKYRSHQTGSQANQER